jgi:hypothetical protein
MKYPALSFARRPAQLDSFDAIIDARSESANSRSTICPAPSTARC